MTICSERFYYDIASLTQSLSNIISNQLDCFTWHEWDPEVLTKHFLIIILDNPACRIELTIETRNKRLVITGVNLLKKREDCDG